MRVRLFNDDSHCMVFGCDRSVDNDVERLCELHLSYKRISRPNPLSCHADFRRGRAVLLNAVRPVLCGTRLDVSATPRIPFVPAAD